MIIKPVNLDIFTRQYVAYLNRNGERIIWVNGFCQVPWTTIETSPRKQESQEMDWKKEIVIVDDGGSCFWNFEINMNIKHTVLYVNGQA